MANTTRLIKAELDGNDGLIVTFSDNTTAAYVVEEMLKLRPHREWLEDSPDSEQSFVFPAAQ
jgi:hypothetical protein